MALGAGICSAVAVFAIAFGSVLAFPLFYLAPLPLYLAGLGIGGKGVAFSMLGAICTAALIGGIVLAVPFAIGYGVPLMTACRRALENRTLPNGSVEWYPAGGIVAILTLLAAGFLVLAGAWVALDPGTEALQLTVSAFLSEALTTMAGQLPADSRVSLVEGLAKFFPGMAAASWVVMHIVNAAIGQNVLVRAGRNIRPRDTYTALVLPDWFSWFLVAGSVLALVGPGDLAYIGRNLVIVLLVPFFLLGLAVTHTAVRRLKLGVPLLAVFYLILVVFGWAAFAVAGIGIIEQWVGIRDRLPADNDRESE